MKLLRISTYDQGYIVEALRSIRMLRIKLAEKKVRFQKDNKRNTWTDEKGQMVSPLQEKTLRRWIRDHQKFVEK